MRGSILQFLKLVLRIFSDFTQDSVYKQPRVSKRFLQECLKLLLWEQSYAGKAERILTPQKLIVLQRIKAANKAHLGPVTLAVLTWFAHC